MYKFEDVGGIYIAYAEVPYKNKENGFEKLPLVFDPGCATTLIDTTVIESLGYTASKDMLRLSTLDGAAGESKGYVVKLQYFRCFDQKIDGLEVACHDLNSKLGISGLLGMNFLRHFVMEIDFKNGVINSLRKL